MKQPFWILNNVLLLILFGILLFIFFSRIKVPTRQSIEPYTISSEKEEAEKIDLNLIYKNDLFNTSMPITTLPIEKEIEEKIPNPPSPVTPNIPEAILPIFFEPLAITLTGIIIQEDETKSKAIILDNKTQNQINYKLGDEIEDAHLIRILKDKIILIRSNGQQETLYLRAEESKHDDINQKTIEAADSAEKISDNNYIIDPNKFIHHVKNLGEFIEKLDLLTAYKQGEAIGVRIGKVENEPLVKQMGLMSGDIVQSINNIQTNNTDNRFEIYKKIISLKESDIIEVNILRNNRPINIQYKLQKIDKLKTNVSAKTESRKLDEDRIESEKIKIMKDKYQFAPTIDEIKLKEKQNLFKRKNSKL